MKKAAIILSAIAALFCACGSSPKKTADAVTVPEDGTDKILEAILNQLQLKREDCYEEFIVNRDIPHNGNVYEDLSAWIIPKIALMDEDGQSFSLDVYILIADNIEGKIVSRLSEPSTLSSDAVRLTNLSIDTVLFLNNDRWAISVSHSYTGSSRPNPYYSTSCSLYVPQGNLLQEIFSYAVSDFHGEWDTNCNGEFESQDGKLILSDKKTNGFYDIILQITTKSTINTLVGEDCQEDVTATDSIAYFKYSGKEYKEAEFDVICTEPVTGVEGSSYEYGVCFYQNKTLEQVYQMLRKEEELLFPTPPAEDTEYTEETEDGDTPIKIRYFFRNEKHLSIIIGYDASSTEIEIIENEKYTRVSKCAYNY